MIAARWPRSSAVVSGSAPAAVLVELGEQLAHPAAHAVGAGEAEVLVDGEAVEDRVVLRREDQPAVREFVWRPSDGLPEK